MDSPSIFLDTDVIIASLLSNTGAASQVLNQSQIKKFISNQTLSELQTVCSRLNIDFDLDNLSQNTRQVEINPDKDRLVEKYLDYVYDDYDSHVIAGAHLAKAKFLITYNLKDYRFEKIKSDLNILVITPGKFLQYLRSQS